MEKHIGVVSQVILFIFLVFFFAKPSFAANFTVTKTTDTNDGVCDADCSLREAIGAANASAGADTITIPAGTYTLSIAGTGEDANATGDLDITDDLTISGAGNTATIIDGADLDRVIEVRPGTTVAIDSVTIQNGKPGASGGGILNRDTLTLTNSTVTSNTGLDFGGGIYNVDTLTITDSTVSGNDTNGFNLSGGGGGIFTEGILTMAGTTVNNNTTLGRGGGIYNLDSTLTLTNSTISGNTALNGGGIFNRFGTVNLTHATIANNTATDNGGGVWNFGGTANFTNTIVSGNTAATAADDCAGSKTSLGYNLAGDASCAFGGTGDQNSTNPLLDPLADNGGPTQTHALQLASPAIDVVPVASCTVAFDQRGVIRPQGVACEVGAFETTTALGRRMTGGGSIGTSGAKHGFALYCDSSRGPNSLEVNWGKGNKFHLESLTAAVCSDDPAINEGQPITGFDTHMGKGTGSYNGVSGATAQWTFTDAGEPGKNDLATLTIRDVNNIVVLTVSANLKVGNHQAH